MALMGSMGAGAEDSAGHRLVSQWVMAKCDTDSCAEVKVEDDRVYVRSTLNHQLVTFTADEWASLKAAIKAGQFDQ